MNINRNTSQYCYKLNTLLFFALFFILSSNTTVQGQSEVVLYENNFTDNSGLVLNYNDCGDDGLFNVEDGAFVINNVEGTHCCTCTGGISCGDNCNVISFPVIDISGIANIDIEIRVKSMGNLECANNRHITSCMDSIPDYDQLDLSINFLNEIGQLTPICCGGCNKFGTVVNDMNVDYACDLYLKLLGGTQDFDEFYKIYYIKVTGTVSACPNIYSIYHAPTNSYNEGSEVLISATTNDCEGEFEYSWYKDGVLVNVGIDFLIEDYSEANTGIYQLFVSDSICTDSLSFELANFIPHYIFNYNYAMQNDGTLVAFVDSPQEITKYNWILNNTIISVEDTLRVRLGIPDVYVLCLEVEGPFYTDGQVCKEVSSEQVTATQEQFEKKLRVFPNPSNNIIYLKDVKGSIHIYNEKGLEVIRIDNHDNSKVDISKLNAGVYYLKTNEGVTKFIKF